jgi:DNA recombination protein RmuC
VTDLLILSRFILLAISAFLLIFVLIKLKTNAGTKVEQAVREELRLGREESAAAAKNFREEVSAGQKLSMDTMVRTIAEMGKSQNHQLESITRRIQELTESNRLEIEKLRSTIDTQLKHLQESNEKKLDQMRETVDEKLQSTLEKRLGQSFKLVSERLEAVQHGLGEMQNLATGVGDLKKVLTNVKTRGTWGEVQLGALLEQILTPDQYNKNVRTRSDSQESVEYAIRLPGQNHDPESCVWMPIDSKFPQEDYLRLVEAADTADGDAVQKATAALLRSVHSSAKEIRDKYLNPPATTDFAIMFLPTEGLYAEVLRQPGQVEKIQQDYRIVVAGPTTLSAILSSLRIGFRTLAIEKRSSEVWKILAAVKTEFGKFGHVLTTVKRQLNTASNTIEQTGVRTRAMERKLRAVEELPSEKTTRILELPDAGKE